MENLFSDYDDRYELLKIYLMNFSELKGTAWYNKCQEYFETIRIHIGKLRLFRFVADEYVIDHWIDEIVRNLTRLVSEKVPNWTIESSILIDTANSWVSRFNSSKLLTIISRPEYSDYLNRLSSYYKINNKKLIEYINNESETCNKVFIDIISIFANHLSIRSVNTRKSTSIIIMDAIVDDIKFKLKELTNDKI